MLIASIAAWLIYRIDKLGIPNVFSREHVFLDERPLTEQVAIELTLRALKADGYDVSVLEPISYLPKQADGNAERFFARGTPSSNHGYVRWGTKDRNTWLSVNIKKEGREIRCRVLRPK